MLNYVLCIYKVVLFYILADFERVVRPQCAPRIGITLQGPRRLEEFRLRSVSLSLLICELWTVMLLGTPDDEKPILQNSNKK